MKTPLRIVNLVALLLCAGFAMSGAQSQSYTGSFTTDADSPSFNFTISQSAPVTIRTFSYAGGTNAAGTAIPGGGFDPTISLFDSSGNLITVNRDGGCGNVAADSTTSFCWDSYLNVTLPAGTYTVVLTQSENLPNGPTLTNSFVYAGQATFTTPPTPAGNAAPAFWDLFPSKRSNAWAFDITSNTLVIPAAPAPPSPLTFTSSGALGGFVPNSTISGSFGATGGTAPYTFSASGLPAGLSLNSSTGAYSGTGGNPGVYSFTVQVTDSETPPVTSSLNVTYSVLGVTTTGLPVGSANVPYSASVSATGGLGAYSFSASGLPAGLSMSSSGAISGTTKTAGNFNVSVQVSSGGLTTSSTLVLTISPAATQPLSVSGGSFAPATVGVAYPAGSGLQASGGVPPYSWSVFGGALPSGMSLNAAGNLQGTPSLAGTYAFTAQVTDSTGATATGAASVVVNAAPLTLTLGNFPNGIAGSAYPVQILTPLAAGGQAPYTFAVTTGALPTGLTLSAQEISGTPTVANTFPFTITVTDSAGKSVQASGSILINPAQATLILSSSSVSFSLTAGASGVPTPAQVTVRSSVVQQPLSFSVTETPSVSWLDVSGGGTTPGSLSVALDPTAPSQSAATTPYATTIVVTCLAPSPCAGNAQTISVSLSVTAPPPQLSLSSSLLSFTAFSATPVVTSQTLGLQNTGGGTINITSIVPGAAWLSVSGAPSSLAAGPELRFPFPRIPLV